MVICLEQSADLHMAQLMPLPLTVSCFSKIQIGFTFLVPAHPGGPGKRAVKRVCVYFLFTCYCVLIGCYDARMRVLAKYLNLFLGISFDKFEEAEDEIVKSFTDECHTPTEYVSLLTLQTGVFIYRLYFCQSFLQHVHICTCYYYSSDWVIDAV